MLTSYCDLHGCRRSPARKGACLQESVNTRSSWTLTTSYRDDHSCRRSPAISESSAMTKVVIGSPLSNVLACLKFGRWPTIAVTKVVSGRQLRKTLGCFKLGKPFRVLRCGALRCNFAIKQTLRAGGSTMPKRQRCGGNAAGDSVRLVQQMLHRGGVSGAGLSELLRLVSDAGTAACDLPTSRGRIHEIGRVRHIERQAET